MPTAVVVFSGVNTAYVPYSYGEGLSLLFL